MRIKAPVKTGREAKRWQNALVDSPFIAKVKTQHLSPVKEKKKKCNQIRNIKGNSSTTKNM